MPGAEEVDQSAAADGRGAEVDGLVDGVGLRRPEPVEELDRGLDPPPAGQLSRQHRATYSLAVAPSTNPSGAVPARYREIEQYLRGLIDARRPG